ncbi:hypothetical protein QZH41_011973 [Actinostola sp. cb2023]|nr:hypothetical protein QZH41_011973 [Actinostola sp. cb2023]
MRFLYPVEVGKQGSGFVGIAKHKDGTEKEFFCRISSFTKLSEFTKELNRNTPAMRNYMIQLPNSALDKLLTELSDDLSISSEDEVYMAVTTIGKNRNRQGEEIWVLSKEVAIDGQGQLVKPRDFGMVWISHLADGDGVTLAKEAQSCRIHLPLGSDIFDTMCHFLRGIDKMEEAMVAAMNNLLPQPLKLQPNHVSPDCHDIDEKEENSINWSNFVSQFCIIAASAITANYTEWQKAIGFCPLVVAVGDPGCGKTKAGNVAIGCTGGYPHLFFNLFTDAYTGQIASQTSMSFQADDPSDPAEVGKGAKRFFSDGSSSNCMSQSLPKCSPIYTVNEHVVKWLQHPDRLRLMERVLLIRVGPRDGIDPSSKWNERFNILLEKVSSVVGEIVKIGQDAHSMSGRDFFSECAEIVKESLSSGHDRQIKMWACALFCFRKRAMVELSTKVKSHNMNKETRKQGNRVERKGCQYEGKRSQSREQGNRVERKGCQYEGKRSQSREQGNRVERKGCQYEGKRSQSREQGNRVERKGCQYEGKRKPV